MSTPGLRVEFHAPRPQPADPARPVFTHREVVRIIWTSLIVGFFLGALAFGWTP